MPRIIFWAALLFVSPFALYGLSSFMTHWRFLSWYDLFAILAWLLVFAVKGTKLFHYLRGDIS